MKIKTLKELKKHVGETVIVTSTSGKKGECTVILQKDGTLGLATDSESLGDSPAFWTVPFRTDDESYIKYMYGHHCAFKEQLTNELESVETIEHTAKKERKTRSDKGKKRGKYGPRNTVLGTESITIPATMQVFCDDCIHDYTDLEHHIGEWLHDSNVVGKEWLVTLSKDKGHVILISKSKKTTGGAGWCIYKDDECIDDAKKRLKEGFKIGWNILGEWDLKQIFKVSKKVKTFKTSKATTEEILVDVLHVLQEINSKLGG